MARGQFESRSSEIREVKAEENITSKRGIAKHMHNILRVILKDG